MNEPNDPTPADPLDDKALSSLYARGSTEQPSNALDRAILEKAHQATRESTRTKSVSVWPRAVSMAAVLVLSITIVMLMRLEAPETLSIDKRQDFAQEEKAAAVTSKAQPTPPARLAEPEGEALAAKDEASPNTFNRLLAKKDQAQRSIGEVLQSRTDTIAPATVPAPETMASAVGTETQGSIAEGKICAQLTEQECFSSAACTLTRNEMAPDYQCRLAKDHCELLFRQSEGTRESCESRTECVYVPANCYCPPDATCQCSGGEPAQCQRRPEQPESGKSGKSGKSEAQ